jgi:membrane-associated phospholipid phosphatase
MEALAGLREKAWSMYSVRRPKGTAGDLRDTVPCQIAQPLIRATRRDWLYLVGQFALVAGVELSDDFAHAWDPLGNAASGISHAGDVMHFEMAHNLWIEPAVQNFFAHPHYILGHEIGWEQIRPLVDAMYGQGHLFFTIFFAMWVFFYRRGLFTFVRNVFLLTNTMAVALYELFPLAPPRLAPDLLSDGHRWQSLNPVWGQGGGIKLSFNEFAAMPSVHVAWATIVGLTLAYTAKPWIIRVIGLIYPLLMATTVIVTGNHYLSDALGAEVVVLIAVLGSTLLAARRTRFGSISAVLAYLRAHRHGEPVCIAEDGAVAPMGSTTAAA